MGEKDAVKGKRGARAPIPRHREPYRHDVGRFHANG